MRVQQTQFVPLHPRPVKLEQPPVPPVRMLNTTNDVLNRISTSTKDAWLDLSSQLDSTIGFDAADNLDAFSSNYLNQEYMMLGDILLHSKPTSPSPSTSSEVMGPPMQVQFDADSQQPRRKRKNNSARPFISLGFPKENQNVTRDENPKIPGSLFDAGLDNPASITNGANQIMQHQPPNLIPYEYVSPLETHNLYRRVQDIYEKAIVEFEYPHSYHSLTRFLKQRFSGNTLPLEAKQRKRANLLIILRLIASYRPTFISAHKSLLKPYDFQFLEMSFQRSLIDCENLAQRNPSPTIIWRRTGEIVSLSDGLMSLLGLTERDILSKRTFIMELMYDDESIVNYFKLFKSVAVGNLHSSINTRCKLIKKEGSQHFEDQESDYIEFCSVWTVKRDLFDIPMLIVGQFLPMFPPSEGMRMY
ncbi:Glucose starvation modulator protein 1 [[Candida] zeylanoides]